VVVRVQVVDTPDSLKTVIGLGTIVNETAIAIAKPELPRMIPEVQRRASFSSDTLSASDRHVVN
jgi:hypothetical protein